MSYTVEDLGKLVKLENPGEYDHDSDIEVGMATKLEHPEAYRDFSDDVFYEVQQLQKYYDSHRGVFTSRWQQRKSGGRTNLNNALSAEQLSVFKMIEQHREAVLQGKMRIENYNRFIAENRLILGELKVRETLIMQALQEGYTLDNWQGEKIKRSDHGREMERLEFEHKCKMEILNIELQLKLSDSVREVEVFREKEAIKLNNIVEEMRQRVRYSLLNSSLENHEKKEIMQEKLDKLYTQIDNIRYGDFSEETKRRMIADREKIIEQYSAYRDSLPL